MTLPAAMGIDNIQHSETRNNKVLLEFPEKLPLALQFCPFYYLHLNLNTHVSRSRLQALVTFSWSFQSSNYAKRCRCQRIITKIEVTNSKILGAIKFSLAIDTHFTFVLLSFNSKQGLLKIIHPRSRSKQYPEPSSTLFWSATS